MTPKPISKSHAKQIWIHAQRLDEAFPFGEGVDAVTRAVEHLGYIQIDTINVIERCHHHILYNRIPSYRRERLVEAQRDAKSVIWLPKFRSAQRRVRLEDALDRFANFQLGIDTDKDQPF